jgi:DNA helicase-2/ATP-dependent DNA helicase PcrA
MDAILSGLNAAQHAAVTSEAAVLQILAPPGSGKTKTLTSRVAFLISHHGFKPWNILCLTFTIKSSREMRERISKLIGDGMEAKLVLGTFHSVCWRYLVSYGHLIGLRKGFSVADTTDSSGIIKRIIKRDGLNIDPRKAQSRISSLKSRGIRLGDLQKTESKSKNIDQQEFLMVFEAYHDQLNISNLLDYDDLLLRCADLLRKHPQCVSNIEVVLIDEFQDTNIVQFDLMTLFSARHRRVTTVGDPDQSIYGWRSAEIKNLGRMQTEYRDTLLIHLEDNYRSSGAILLAASEIIEQDSSRPARPILPTHCPGTVPVLRKLPSAEIEAKWIVAEITRVIGMAGGLLTHGDIAILLRSASLSRHIEAAMGKAGIPYRIVGGQKFFDRLEIKILLDYLRVVSQPDNNDALSRIINVPARNIGVTTVKALLDEAEAKKMTLWALVRDSVQGRIKPRSKISKQGERAMAIFLNLILSTRSRLLDTDNPSSPEELLKLIIKKLDFGNFLEKYHENDHEGRWANVEELLVQAAEFLPSLNSSPGTENQDTLPQIEGLDQAQGNPAEEALSRFLANVALATELQRDDANTEGDFVPHPQVTISTIHAAKGLEWPVVFIPSAYEGSIPHSRAEDTDEERRLLYVAMTRAQALLYLSWPMRNSQKGKFLR